MSRQVPFVQGFAVAYQKYAAEIPISWELVFDVTPWDQMNLETRKAYLRLGHGMGRRVLMCEWPRHRYSRGYYHELRRVWRQELDLSDCPYYKGRGTCSQQPQCREEPSCITDCPEEGWPSERH